eukprot:366356-Chlamydomonas_euryale.AAC.4
MMAACGAGGHPGKAGCGREWQGRPPPRPFRRIRCLHTLCSRHAVAILLSALLSILFLPSSLLSRAPPMRPQPPPPQGVHFLEPGTSHQRWPEDLDTGPHNPIEADRGLSTPVRTNASKHVKYRTRKV